MKKEKAMEQIKKLRQKEEDTTRQKIGMERGIEQNKK